MKRFLTLGLLGMGLVGLLLAEVGAAETAKGEQMLVAAQNAPLMRGSSTLARLPAGHRFEVIRTEGNWVGTRATVNGKPVSGWLWRGYVATPQQFARRQELLRRYSYIPMTEMMPTVPELYARTFPQPQPLFPAARGGPMVAEAVPGASRPYKGPYPYARPVLWPDMGDYVTGGLRANSPLLMGTTWYSRNYWRADRKIIGY
ncbi:MAG TPA: hypothetical protein VNH11_19940 [Pirellulales bacterium]|nr:hypothetical protein [Pirellulales bacterium]